MATLTAPLGNLETLGIGKETNYGVFATPTLWHAHTDFAPKPKNELIPLTGARKHYGQTRPRTAGFTGDASLDVEQDADTIPQLLAYALGAQTAPTLFQYVSTTLTGATTIGATTFAVADVTNIFPGQTITFDTAGNIEPLLVSAVVAVAGNTGPGTLTTAAAAKAHASGVTVTASSTVAYGSNFTMGNLPSFSIELNRVTDAVRYLGCVVDSMAFSIAAKAGLSTKYTLVYQSEFVTTPAATATPTFSTKGPYIFENPYNIASFNGSVIGQPGQVTVLSANINLANNLMKGYRSFGGGRIIQSFPQLQRKVTGSVTLGFETNAAYLAFLGSTTGPALVTVPGITLSFKCVASDFADPTAQVYYAITFKLGAVTLSMHEVNNKSNSVLEQTFQFESAESGAGNNDDLSVSVTTTSPTIY